MFKHELKYSLKVLLKNKILLFWTLAFPLIIGIFFNMAFSDVEKNEKLDIIDIAIIENKSWSEDIIFKNAFESLSDDKNKERMFNITYTDKKNVEKLLEEEKITGYIEKDKNVNLVVKHSDINETSFKYVIEEINSNKEIIETLSKKEIEENYKNGVYTIDYQKIYQEVINLINKEEVELNDISKNNLSYTMIEYYTLIAMTALYGGILSMFMINKHLANMDSVGKRIAISPIKKGKMLLATLLASYLIQLFGLLLLFLFTIFILKVEYGTNIILIILLAIIGSFAGLCLGIAVATLSKSGENTKTGILLAITMFGCFLSGMMGITMKYIIDSNIPLLNKINPASMITDGLYSLYYFDTYNRFIFDIVSLIIFSLVMILLSIRGLRRTKYDSI